MQEPAMRDLDSALVSLRDRANACVCVCVYHLSLSVCISRTIHGIAAVNSIFACTAPERAPIARSRMRWYTKSGRRARL